MKSRIKKALIFILLLIPLASIAEGWKEMRPNNAVSGSLYFHWWGCYSSNPFTTDDYRVHIHIKSLSEKIYYGFNFSWSFPPYIPIRILNPDGNVVQTSNIQNLNGSPGWIND